MTVIDVVAGWWLSKINVGMTGPGWLSQGGLNQRMAATEDNGTSGWRRQGMTTPVDDGTSGWGSNRMTAPTDAGVSGWRRRKMQLGGWLLLWTMPQGMTNILRVTARGGWQLCKDDDFRERWPRAVLSSTSLPDCRCLQWRRVAHGRDARAQTPGPGSDPRTAQSFAKKETTTF